jgi:hypothetical protein
LPHIGEAFGGTCSRRNASAAAVRGLVPGIHRGESHIVLMHDQHRRLSDRGQRAVGDHERDLDDAIGLRPEPRHLHVDPDQMIGVLRHRRRVELA